MSTDGPYFDVDEWGGAGRTGRMIANAEAGGGIASIGAVDGKWVVTFVEDPEDIP